MNKASALQSQLLFATAKGANKKDTSLMDAEMQKLDDLGSVDNGALYMCQTVFPFDLFPDKITVDRNKITISKHFFFFTRAVQSIMIADLLTVVVEETILFSTLQVVDRMFPQDTIQITHLQKNDAKQLRWILEGLIIGKKEAIDFAKIPNEQLVPKLVQIGKTKVA